MIPPDAAERFAFEKNVDSRKDRAIVAIPYIVRNVNMTRGSALLSTFPYWNKKLYIWISTVSLLTMLPIR